MKRPVLDTTVTKTELAPAILDQAAGGYIGEFLMDMLFNTDDIGLDAHEITGEAPDMGATSGSGIWAGPDAPNA